MSPIMMLAVVWAVLTVALIIVLIYRSTLSMHEDDQLFLDDSTSNLRAEQEQLMIRDEEGRAMGAYPGRCLRITDPGHRRYGDMATR